MTYKYVMKAFKEAKYRYCLTDEYLLKNGAPTRGMLPICDEYEHGVVRVRDDAVQLLIDRIYELEWKLSNAKG